ncbi:hypothetical protein K491DRAFT_691434, partial [Lophiostoma macrostomum CBS 122681]
MKDISFAWAGLLVLFSLSNLLFHVSDVGFFNHLSRIHAWVTAAVRYVMFFFNSIALVVLLLRWKIAMDARSYDMVVEDCYDGMWR